MSTNAAQLLWNRKRITISGPTLAVDTGLRQANMSFETNSVGEPPFGVPGTVAPPDGTPPASRIQVVPLSPIGAWADIAHSEPWFNTTTDTVWVTFSSSNEIPVEFNVLFWDPHTSIGPGEADTYHSGNR